MSGHGEEIVRLWKEIADSPGGQLRYDLETLEVTVQVFKTNHHWLHELLARYENPEFAYGIWPEHIGDFLVEVAVRLHNFVASVMTLVEHTRILVWGQVAWIKVLRGIRPAHREVQNVARGSSGAGHEELHPPPEATGNRGADQR